ncbi:MAG: cation transporter [Lachnospiraceae bacterium]|nr:cation transporter [Lachnospiraceae bacterium]
MANIITVMILILIISFAVYGIVDRIRFGSSCCGTKNAGEKKVKVEDKNKDHYQFKYILSVEGMHCSNCARHIENAFNKTGERWASANVEKKEVILLSKHEETEEDLRRITSSAGYTFISYSKQ